jgi:acetyl esterase
MMRSLSLRGEQVVSYVVPVLRLPAAVEGAVIRLVLDLPPGLQRRLTKGGRVIADQRIAPELQLMLGLQRFSPLELGVAPVEASRAELVRMTQAIGGHQAIGATRDLEVDGAKGPLRARLYTPTERLSSDSSPTLLFVHGGGWVYGSIETHDAACRVLAERSGVQILSIDYALAPEEPYPAAVHDCVAAHRWLVENAAAVGADPQRLGVGGDSAGGNLAAVVALHAADAGLPLAFQLLIYPGTDMVEEAASRGHFQDEGLLLTRAFLDQALDLYVPSREDRAQPDASPYRREELPQGLAAAHVVTAALDPLRDEGEAYAERLRAHGTPVTVEREPGMVHGFLHVVGAGREAPAAVRRIADALRGLAG